MTRGTGRVAPQLPAGADRPPVLLEHVARSPARERPRQPARVDRKSDPAGAPGEWRGSGVHTGLSGWEIASCPFPARSRPPTLRTPSSPTLPQAPARRMAIVIARPEGIGIFPGDGGGLRPSRTRSPPLPRLRREQFPARTGCPRRRPVLSPAVAGGSRASTCSLSRCGRGSRTACSYTRQSGGSRAACSHSSRCGGSRVAVLPLLRLRATRSAARSHTRFREGSGHSCSLARFREGSRERLSTPCLHKGTCATESVRGSVCVTAVLSRGPVITSTTTSKGTPAPSLPSCPETEGAGISRLSDPTELCRLEDKSTLAARSLRRANRRSRTRAPCMWVHCSHNMAISPLLIVRHYNNIRQSNKLYTVQYYTS